MTQEDLWRDIGTLKQMHFEFCELVKKMRDAQKRTELRLALMFQKEIGKPISKQDTLEFSSAVDKMYDVEEKVDEYLVEYFKT